MKTNILNNIIITKNIELIALQGKAAQEYRGQHKFLDGWVDHNLIPKIRTNHFQPSLEYHKHKALPI